MITIENNRIMFNRPDYPSNIVMTSYGNRIKPNVFDTSMNGISNSIISGAKSSESMINMQHPLPQVFDSYRRNYLPGVAISVKNMQKAAIAEKKRINDVFNNNLRSIHPIGEARAMMMLQMLQNKKPAEIFDMMLNNRDIAALVLEDANFKILGLPEAGRAELEKNIWRINTERNFRLTVASAPTLDDLLGEKINSTLAGQLADNAAAELENSRDDLKTVTTHMRHVIDHAALMADVSDAEVFSMVQKAA